MNPDTYIVIGSYIESSKKNFFSFTADWYRIAIHEFKLRKKFICGSKMELKTAE